MAWWTSFHGAGLRLAARRGKESQKPRGQRPRRRLTLELLEARLPPGDAFLAGLLALPAVGSLPAEQAGPPGMAPRLAAEEGLAEVGALVLFADPADARHVLVPSFTPASPETGPSERGERFPAAVPARRAAAGAIPDAAPLPVGPASPVLDPAGSAGASGSAFVALPPANYQLDQAVAAVVPGPELDDLSPPDLDTGPGVQSSGVRALFNLGHPTTGPFPSNVFTVPDPTMNTDRRVNLPYPDCQVYVSDCEDIAVLNELDGFNLEPRLSVPFSGPIDVNSVTSATAFLVSLGSTVPDQGYMPRGTVVGINQVVWDVETNTLHVESDEVLAQHTRFALLVTNGLRDANGDRVEASPEFRRFRQTVPQPYKRELLDAIQEARRLGVRERDIVTASVFTTESATAGLEKIRDRIKAETPAPADFLLGPKGERTVFAFDQVVSFTSRQQTGDNPPSFGNPINRDLSLLRIYPGAVGQFALGKYVSPDYEVHPGEYIPAVGTRTGTPVVQGFQEVYFNLIVPSGPKPAGGWPVAIIGHGGAANKDSYMNLLGASFARHGVASLLINYAGYGFGPLSTSTVGLAGTDPITFLAGGRSFDQNGDRVIANEEGHFAARPRQIIRARDGIRQTAADLMQLVRVIEVGMDVDGDGLRDLDPSRIHYYGQSSGSQLGIPFLAVEPSVATGVLATSATSGWLPFSPGQRAGLGGRLAARVPSLINAPGVTEIEGVAVAAPHFQENRPVRDGHPVSVRLADGTPHEIRSPVVNTVPGAAALQEAVDRGDWVTAAGNPVGSIAHLRRAPLPGMSAKSILFLFAKGDQTIPNPGTSALIRAGELASQMTYYRHDLAYADNPALPKNPHEFVTSIFNMAFRPLSLSVQQQVATFLGSDGRQVIHPEPKQYFEVPIQGPLPEELNFIP